MRLVDEAPLGIYIVQDGRIVFGNRWLNEFSGYQPGDLPIPALQVIAPEHRAMVQEQMTRRLEGAGASPSYNVRFLKRNGTVADVELVARSVTYQDRPAIQGSIVDVSERIAAARMLKEYAMRLEEANHFRQLMAEVVNHDLANRLWIVERYAAMLGESGLTPGPQQQLSAMLRGALSRTVGLVNEAAASIKVSERTAISPVRLDLAALVREATARTVRLAEERNVTVGLDLPDHLPCHADPILCEALVNLLGVALRESSSGSAIEVAAAARENALSVRVTDDGRPLPVDLQEKLLEGFERFDRHAAKGIGLGLAVVKRVADLHGGLLRVEERSGGGTVYVLELPQALDH